MPPFSRRSHRDFTPNAYARALADLRTGANGLVDLSSGNPTEHGLGLSSAQLAELLTDERLAVYEPAPFGLPVARAALSRDLVRVGATVGEAHILLTASTSEAYGMLFKLLCDPGDAVLVPVPSYPLLDVLARLESVNLVPYQLAYDGEWHMDGASLRAAQQAAAGRARAVVTVHPNNPTGSYLKAAELETLAALGLPIISDEVFSDYALEGSSRRVRSALSAAPETLVFRLSGLSKSLLLPQLKLAFTAIDGPRALVDAACERLEHIADAYLSPASPVQLALPRLLALRELVQQPVLARVRRNLALLRTSLTASAATVLSCEGGWYAIVQLPAVESDEAWCLRLMRDHALVVQPGYLFDLEGTHAVLSLISDPAAFAEGIARLRRAVDSSR